MSYKTERDLSNLYKKASDPQIAKDKQIAQKRISAFVNKRKNEKPYMQDVDKLREALDEYEALMADYLYGPKENPYFLLQTFLSQDEHTKALSNKAQLFARDLMLQLEFFELDIAKIPLDQQKVILKKDKIKPYKHFLERIFATAKHNLSEAEEAIITKLSKGAYANRTTMTEDFFSKEEGKISIDMKKKETKTFEELLSLCADTNKNTRDQAGQAIHQITANNADVAEKELNSVLEFKYTMDQLRGYTRPDQSRHLEDDIDTQVVDTLVEVIQDNYDISHQYYAIKAKLIGQEKIQYHERQVPIITGKELQYTFEQGIAIVKKVFEGLDPHFVTIFEQFLEQGRIDVFPKKGKMGGAYNIGMGKNITNLVMLNWTNKLNDITTLAHEMGHAIHTQTIYKKQNALNGNYGMCVAEVASTFMEDYVYEQILKDADPNTKIQIQMERLNDFVSAVSRQIACYTTEQDLHEQRRKNGYLSKETIGDIYLKHMNNYMGPSVEMTPGSENRRTYRSHIRMYFYVYSYASGYLIAKALQHKVRQNPGFIKDYISIFLSAGTSEAPKQTFKKMGIDITDKKFREDGIDEVKKILQDVKLLTKQTHFTNK